MTKALVTGATGFLGGRAAQRFAAEGFEVVATGRKASRGVGLTGHGLRFVPSDLRVPKSLDTVCRGADMIVHCAALSSAWAQPASLFEAVNVEGTLALLAAAQRAGVKRFVHVSTPAVLSRLKHQYQLTEEQPLPETFTSLYGATKAKAEQLVLEAEGLETVVIRPKAIYGPGDTALLPRLVEAAERGRLPIIGDGKTLIDLTHIDDAVSALLLAATTDDVSGVYHVAGPQQVNLWEMLTELLPLLGCQGPHRRLSVNRAMRLAKAMEITWNTLRLASEPPLTRYKVAVLAYSQTLDTTRARKELGFNPEVSLQAGLNSVLSGPERSRLADRKHHVRLSPTDGNHGVEVDFDVPAVVHPPSLLVGSAGLRRATLPVITATVTHPDRGRVWFDTGYPTASRRTGLFDRFYDWLLAPELSDRHVERGPGTVVISHADPDHVGGLDRFPNAEIAMAPETWDQLSSPRAPWRWRGVRVPPDINDRIRFLDVSSGPVDLFRDGSITAVALPGHAPGHLGLRVQGQVPILLCGDAVLRRTHVRRSRLGIFRLIASDRAQASRTLTWLHDVDASESTMLVPSHCAETATELLGTSWRDSPTIERRRIDRSRDKVGQPAKTISVVIPVYNERAVVVQCLDSLAAQTDPGFSVVIVDNGSTDGSQELIEEWIREHPDITARLVHEPRKGTGAAADTGFRLAIQHGADWIARTDADCLAAPDWIASIRRRSAGADMLGGKIRPRTDEVPLQRPFIAVLSASIAAAQLAGRLRPSNRGSEYLCPYVMCVGNNMAARATVYEAAGGFPRLAIEELAIPNDRAFVNRVRRVSDAVRYAPDMVVYNSTRRVRAYGLIRTLRWYFNHQLDSRQFEVDIR